MRRGRRTRELRAARCAEPSVPVVDATLRAVTLTHANLVSNTLQSLEALFQGANLYDRERVLSEWQHSAEGSVDFDSHYRLVRPDGTVRQLRVKARAIVAQGSDGGDELPTA